MSTGWSITVESEAETKRLARKLGELAVPGTVVALVGDLGAGKTRFAQGLAAGLGVDERVVNSPTFVLIQEYPGRLPMYHFDTYRLRDVSAFLELGAEEYLAGEGVCLIEWADRVEPVLPADRLTVRFSIAGPESRRLDFAAGGATSLELLERLRQ